MSKKLFKISLIAGIFGLFIFGVNFSLAAVIGPPQLNSPEPDALDVSLAPTFKWQGGIDSAGRYWYEINILKYESKKGEFVVDKKVEFIKEVVGPEEEVQQTLTGLVPDKDYWWWVRVCSENQKYCDNWSEKRKFHTEEKAPPPSNGGPPGDGLIGLINPLKADNLEDAINAFINFLFFLAMAVGPILIIYAAFLILTAGGKPEQINKSKTIILWTLIAIAIVLFAKGLPAVIKGALGG